MHQIVKRFGGVAALNGIDLKIRPGECIGLCGENGAGKSTLMKVLSAVYPHGSWEGEILWEGQPLRAHSVRETEAAGIIIIHQELMLVPELSVAENIFLGHELTLPGGRMNYPAMNQRAEALLRELKLPDVNVVLPVKQYGGGHQQLIEIAKALNKQAKLLILDEPSASLTAAETEVLLEIVRGLKAKGVACVYISHKLEEVAAICDTVVVIRDGQHIASTPMAQMDVPTIVAQMVGREMSQMYPHIPHEVGEVVLEARNISCYDPDQPSRKRVDDVSFTLRKGEVLGIAGLVGAGRTELVSKLFGAYGGMSEGEIWLNGRKVENRTPLQAIAHGFALVPEDRKQHGIVPDLGVGANITLSVLQRYTRLTRIDSTAELLAIHQQISQLALKTATIIMVSSELPEVLGISDRVLVMGEGRLCGDFINQNLTQEQLLAAAIGQEQYSLFTQYKLLALMVAIALIWAFFSWKTDGDFATARNLSNLMRQMAITGILACGMVFIIIAGEIDLSV
eukprot:gene18072-17921_t